MFYRIIHATCILLFCGGGAVLVGVSCKEKLIVSIYKYHTPVYDSIGLFLVEDTASFPLEDNFYNQIKSFNYFVNAGTGYLALYDRGSQSVGLFDFEKRQMVSRINLKKFIRKKDFYKTAVFVKNFDTIVVTNKSQLIIVDTSGVLKFSCTVPKGQIMVLDNASQPLIKRDGIVVPGKMSASSRDLDKIRSWRLLYEMRMDEDRAIRKYPFPRFYAEKYYGKHLMRYYTCANSSGRMVVSFAADSLLYETDLEGDQYAYFARSRFQKDPIRPVTKAIIENDQESEEFLLRDSYGPVYYDWKNSRYVRVASRAVTRADLQKGNKRRSFSLIILNEKFKIVGEQVLDSVLNVGSMFFDKNGELYYRVNAENEFAVRFVKLSYKEREHNNNTKR